MLTVESAASIIYDTVAFSRRHADYERTVELADLYLKLYTGEGAEELLQQILQRETKEEFDLRKKLFFPIAPAVCKKARVPFAKVPKADGIIDDVIYEGNETDKRERLDKALDEFYGDENLSDYMAERYLDLNITDPNAYVMVDFEPFDNAKERARPYPLEVSSRQCINKGVKNNATEWIIGEFPWEYTETSGKRQIKREGKRYVMYFGQVIDLQQVQHNSSYPRTIDPSQQEQYVTIQGPDRKISFLCRIINPFIDRQTPEFQGVCAGHIKDPYTQGRTFVSTIHAAKYRLLSALKAGSEHSLTMALTAHPQVFAYLPKCDGTWNEGIHNRCDHGVDEHGKQCSGCGGSGKKLPTSVLNATYFMLDERQANDDGLPFDLSKLKHYSAPDAAIIEILSRHITDIEQGCLQDIFTSASLESKPLETATRVAVDEDAQNSAVYPYGRKWATVKIKLTRLVAMFVDADEGMEVACKVPSRLQLAPYEVMLDRAQKAKTIDPALANIAKWDALNVKLAERPLELRRTQIMEKYRPMDGLSEADKIANRDLLTLEDRILLTHERMIYDNLDLVEGFYYMADAKQRELIGAEVLKIKERILKEKAADVDFGIGPEPVDQEEEVGVAA